MSTQIINTFYSAFKNKDYKTMTECYTDDAEFTDGVFQLKSPDIGLMWHMLCERGKDLDVHLVNVVSKDNIVTANWVALYTFSKTGRQIENNITATFTFKENKIIQHTDSFDFYKWAKMAFGLKGLLFGKFLFFRKIIQQYASKSLTEFKANN